MDGADQRGGARGRKEESREHQSVIDDRGQRPAPQHGGQDEPLAEGDDRLITAGLIPEEPRARTVVAASVTKMSRARYSSTAAAALSVLSIPPMIVTSANGSAIER